MEAVLDTQLMELLATRGEHTSTLLVLATGARTGTPTLDEYGRVNCFGETVLMRWDELCKNWGNYESV